MAVRAPSASVDAGPLLAIGLAKIGLVLRHEAWQRRTRDGLTPTQSQILALLHARRGTGMRLADIADGLGVSAATASDSVRVLAEKGLVLKKRSQADARSLAVRLTGRGAEEAARASQWPDFLLEAIDALGEEERAVFLRGLTKMIRVLQEQGRIPPARMCATCRYFRPNAHRDPRRPHHCAFVDAPFGEGELRLDCADQEPLPPAEAGELWEAFLAGRPREGTR